jgi:hypothetical protein
MAARLAVKTLSKGAAFSATATSIIPADGHVTHPRHDHNRGLSSETDEDGFLVLPPEGLSKEVIEDAARLVFRSTEASIEKDSHSIVSDYVSS